MTLDEFVYLTYQEYPFHRNNNLAVNIRLCGTWQLSYLALAVDIMVQGAMVGFYKYPQTLAPLKQWCLKALASVSNAYGASK